MGMGSMNRINDKGYTGTLVFVKHVRAGYFTVRDYTEEEFNQLYRDDDDYILLGSCEVDVEFKVDTREAEIASLEKVREKMRAEMGAAIEQVTDKIESLRALPNLSEEVEA